MPAESSGLAVFAASSEGIRVYAMQLATGAMELITATKEPGGFLAVDRAHWRLFAVADGPADPAQPKARRGLAFSYAIDPLNWSLRKISQRPTDGTSGCSITVDATGRCVLAASFRDHGRYGADGHRSQGSIAALGVADDGTLAGGDVKRHEGASVHPDRQTASHPHSVTIDRANRFAVVADLGIDKVIVYRLDIARVSLEEASQVATPEQSGPRHFAFHPSGRFGYLVNEIANTIIAYSYDPERGQLAELQVLSTLPPDVTSAAIADVHVSPDGRFVYVSNRGHDSIAVFAIDPDKGALAVAGHQRSGGKDPRGFAIDPTGRFLLAANQGSNNIVVFAIDPQTGQLRDTGHKVEIPGCGCVVPIAR